MQRIGRAEPSAATRHGACADRQRASLQGAGPQPLMAFTKRRRVAARGIAVQKGSRPLPGTFVSFSTRRQAQSGDQDAAHGLRRLQSGQVGNLASRQSILHPRSPSRGPRSLDALLLCCCGICPVLHSRRKGQSPSTSQPALADSRPQMREKH